jgi:hypothetical protein
MDSLSLLWNGAIFLSILASLIVTIIWIKRQRGE